MRSAIFASLVALLLWQAPPAHGQFRSSFRGGWVPRVDPRFGRFPFDPRFDFRFGRFRDPRFDFRFGRFRDPRFDFRFGRFPGFGFGFGNAWDPFFDPPWWW